MPVPSKFKHHSGNLRHGSLLNMINGVNPLEYNGWGHRLPTYFKHSILNWPHPPFGSHDVPPWLRITKVICQKANDFQVSEASLLACEKEWTDFFALVEVTIPHHFRLLQIDPHQAHPISLGYLGSCSVLWLGEKSVHYGVLQASKEALTHLEVIHLSANTFCWSSTRAADHAIPK